MKHKLSVDQTAALLGGYDRLWEQVKKIIEEEREKEAQKEHKDERA